MIYLVVCLNVILFYCMLFFWIWRVLLCLSRLMKWYGLENLRIFIVWCLDFVICILSVFRLIFRLFMLVFRLRYWVCIIICVWLLILGGWRKVKVMFCFFCVRLLCVFIIYFVLCCSILLIWFLLLMVGLDLVRLLMKRWRVLVKFWSVVRSF